MKKQLVQFNIPDMTAKQYDRAWEELRKAGQTSPSGMLYHVGAQQGKGWVVIEVWESMEAFNKYGETLMPILSKLGIITLKHVITPVHYEYEAAKVFEAF